MASVPSGDGVKGRRLFVMRHGERCDFAFGKTWVNRCFDGQGNYKQLDLNLPISLPPRTDHKDYIKDSPLTELGKFQARATGDAFKRAGLDIKHVYVSPSFRCIQTAQNVVDGMHNDAQLCIEPTAFEWFGWYKNSMPNWMSAQELKNHGFNINVDHSPLVSVKDLQLDETVKDYYNRCHRLAQHLLGKHEKDGGDILIVAHAGSLDTHTRFLLGKPSRSDREMHQILSSFTYCCLCCAVENPHTKMFSLTNPPIAPLQNFDWRALLK